MNETLEQQAIRDKLRSSPAMVATRRISGAAALLVMFAVLAGCGGGYSGLGSRSHPIPVGRAADIGDGWRLKVLRVTPKAKRVARTEAKATPPPKRSRYLLIRLVLTYTGNGGQVPSERAGLAAKGYWSDVLSNGLKTIGTHGASYTDTNNPCGIFVPGREDWAPVVLHPGQTARGYLCIQIPANDARTLLLHTGYFHGLLEFGVKGLRDRWFVLPSQTVGGLRGS